MSLNSDEALKLLMAISRIDGFLLSLPNSEHVTLDVEFISDMLVAKLTEIESE